MSGALSSLRWSINDTLCRYNIKYGNMDATDAEVEEAAVLADIHDTILSFPDKVGIFNTY